MRAWVIAAALVTGCGSAAADAAPLRSGLYGGLVLAVAPDGSVQGHFREDQGQGVVKSCAFTVSGRVDADNRAAIVARAGSNAVRGRLQASDDGVVLALSSGRSLPGCGLVLDPAIDSGIDLEQIASGTWHGLVRVKLPRVALKPQIGGPAGRAYVVRGDVLGVLAKKGTQVQVVYPSSRARPSQGWVDVTALAPLTP